MRELLPGDLKEKKGKIEQNLMNGDIEAAQSLLNDYEYNYPKDIDVIALHVNIELVKGDLNKALYYARKGVICAPLNGDMLYNIGYVYELLGDFLNAYLNYSKADWLYNNTFIDRRVELDIENKIDTVIEKLQNSFNDSSDIEELIKKRMLLNNAMECERNSYGFAENAFRSYEKIIGKYIHESIDSKRYVAIANEQFTRGYTRLLNDSEMQEYDLDLVHLKGEMLYVQEGTGIRIESDTDDENTEYVIPIAADEYDTVHIFDTGDGENQVVQRYDKYFAYYRVKNNTNILSSKKSYYGSPIPLCRSNKRKRLVLSVFVDGLAGQALTGDDFVKNMPHTFRFFKNGAIFDNAYACGEWTYPSIANIVSGLYTNNHMLFHNTIDGAISDIIPTLFEYYKEKGYYTALFSSDWRIIPTYGYGRGIDRYIYQSVKCGYRAENVIGDVINHMSAFDETDQYIWLSIGDLHDISDGDETSIDVQTHTSISLRAYGDIGKTSVKQNYSNNKTLQFIDYVRHIDMWLNVLYNYINDNFKNEEIVVSLFADHGQGYMIPDGRTFLSKERTNVAFMFKGGLAQDIGRSDEMVSTVDYGCIMRRLCGLTEKNVKIDGRLPMVFGGDEERKYTVTESLHPGDPYQIVINEKEYAYYFVNPEPVQDDGRFLPGKYEHWIEDSHGRKIDDNEKLDYYYNIVRKHIESILIYE